MTSGLDRQRDLTSVFDQFVGRVRKHWLEVPRAPRWQRRALREQVGEREREREREREIEIEIKRD